MEPKKNMGNNLPAPFEGIGENIYFSTFLSEVVDRLSKNNKRVVYLKYNVIYPELVVVYEIAVAVSKTHARVRKITVCLPVVAVVKKDKNIGKTYHLSHKSEAPLVV